jgi:serine/threonine protein kinase
MLLHKLIEINTSKRYSADKIMKHPWITRKKYDKIPKTYLENIHARTLRNKMITVNIK